ncbi:hypothetical protein BCR44DRAFT_279625 [Catenaria anguillulae PL171]|uniref:Uncharacterized protein n=1 Tax=Catenaria anguillulae PL171 TaxID=765915 RepID=A0A1Y2HN40_9FUNG|nr:hypothetical protein BCR44DRAFT_279625 [Catenaria anguillulae PL171]
MRDGLVQVSINSDPIAAQTFNRPRGEQDWPPPRSAPLVMSLNDTHVFVSGGFVERGGRGIEYLTDWWLYNVPESKWVRGDQPMAAGRASHRGVFVGDRYIVQSGGWTRIAASPFLEYVDLLTGRVSVLSIPRSANDPAPAPTPTLTMHNSLLVRNQLILFGGYAEFNQTLPALRHNTDLFIAQIDTRPNDPAAPIRGLWLTAYIPASANDSAGDSTGEQSTGVLAPGGHSKLSIALISGAVSACVVFLIFGLLFAFAYARRRDTLSAVFGRRNRPNRRPSTRSKPSFSPIPIRPHVSRAPAVSSSRANPSVSTHHDAPSRPPRPSSEYSSFTSLPGRIMEPTTHLLDDLRQYRDLTTGAELNSDWASAHASRRIAEERVVSVVESEVSRISSWDAGDSNGIAMANVDGEDPSDPTNSPPSVLQQLVRQYQISSRGSTGAASAQSQARTPSKSPRLLTVPSLSFTTPTKSSSPRPPSTSPHLHQRLKTTSTHQSTPSSLFDSPLSPIQPHPSRRLPSTLLTARHASNSLAPLSAPRSTASNSSLCADTGRRPSQSPRLSRARTSRVAHDQRHHPLHPVSIATASDSSPSADASPRLIPSESLPRASQPRSTSVPADILAAVMFTTNPKLQPPPADGVGSPLSTRANLELAETRRQTQRPSQLRPISAITSGSSATVPIPRASSSESRSQTSNDRASLVDVSNANSRTVHTSTRSYEAYDLDQDKDLADHHAAAAADSTLPSYILARSVSDSARASSAAPDDPNATHNDKEDDNVVISAGTILHINPAATAPVVSAPPALRLAPPLHLRPIMDESIATTVGRGTGQHTGYLTVSLSSVADVSFPPPAARSASILTTTDQVLLSRSTGFDGTLTGTFRQGMDDSGAELDRSVRTSREVFQ